MVSLVINRKKSILLLALISLQSFILAETASPKQAPLEQVSLDVPAASLQQTASPSTETSTQKTDLSVAEDIRVDAQTQQPATSAKKEAISVTETVAPVESKSSNQQTVTSGEQTTTSAQQSENSTPDYAQLEPLLNAVLQQTNQIDSLIQDIALVISNNQSWSKDQRAAVAKEIRTLRDQLSIIRNQSFTQADPQSIYLLLGINKELCDHLEKSLAKGFKTLDPFPLTEIISKRAVRTLLNVDQLTQAVADNELSVAKLGRSAENIGLTWYNKLYRKIDGYAIQPWQKYNMTHYSILFFGTVAAATTLWWVFTEPSESTSRITKWIHEKMGPEPTYGYYANKTMNAPTSSTSIADQIAQSLPANANEKPLWGVTNKKDLKLPGLIKYGLKDFGITPLAATLYVCSYLKDDYTKVKNAVTKKVVEIHNNLKGGVFKNRTIKTSVDDYFKIATGSFDDIIGSENAKDILSGVVDYLVNPEKFELAKIIPGKCYLFTGPTRTGKSFMADCFAGEVRKRLTAAGKSPDAVHYLPADVGVISKIGGITGFVELAKMNAPCIIFIDEIDLLGLQRAGGNSTLLADFLVALSDLTQKDVDKQIVVLAATNRSENLDGAIKAPGRLGDEIRFSYPSFDYRKNYFVHKLESIGISTETLDLDSLTRQTVGRSYNHLDKILRKALHEAKVQTRQLDQELLERAIDTELFLILPEHDHPLSEQERIIVATTVAGTILVDYLLDTGAPVLRATMNPYLPPLKETSPWEAFYKEEAAMQELIKYGKVFTASIFEYLNQTYTTVQLKNTCKSLLAGRCAQQLILGVATHDNDTRLNMQKSYAIAKELVNKGLDGKMLSDTMRDSFADKAYALMETFEQETTALLTEHKEQLERLIAVLLKLGTLNREEIAIIIEGKLPESLEAALKTGAPEVIKHPAVA